MVMSLCKKSVLLIFNLTTSLDTTKNDPHKLSASFQCHSQISSSSSLSGGLGLITANDINGNDEGGVCSRRMRRSRMKFGDDKKFPPPFSSLNHNGRRNFFLRAVRKDGRLELTEVRLDRAETLRASREDGRLRLHLIQDCIETEEQEEENLEVEQEEEEKELVEEEKEERVEEWKFPMSGEGLRQCIEMASHDHHNQYHHQVIQVSIVWRQLKFWCGYNSGVSGGMTASEN